METNRIKENGNNMLTTAREAGACALTIVASVVHFVATGLDTIAEALYLAADVVANGMPEKEERIPVPNDEFETE